MTKQEWVRFSLKLWLGIVSGLISFIACTIILQDYITKHGGVKYRFVCHVEETK